MRAALYKVIVIPFYKINLGFFLFAILLLFGVTNAHDTVQFHYAIMSAITSSPLYFAIAALVWGLYNIKCVAFSLKQVALAENSFLYNLQAVNSTKQLLLLARIQTAVYSPVLLHGAITAAVGFANHQYLLPACVILFHLFMCIVAALICYNRLNKTYQKPLIGIPQFALFPQKRFLFYLVHYSLHSRKATFAAVKFFSLLLLQIMVAANSDKPSREAICVLIMFLISAHALLPYYYVRFVELDMAFLRNLPLTLGRRFLVYVITYIIIFIPELFFLLWNAHAVLPVAVIVALYSLAICQLSFYTALQYFGKMTSERYTMIVFVVFFASVFSLASVNMLLLAGIEIIVAILFFCLLYYRYEHKDAAA